MAQIQAEITIQNVVASCQADSRIPLSRLAMELEGTEYEPQQFPGLVVRLAEPKSAALVFNTGKIVSTGTKSPQQAKKAVEVLLVKIKKLGVPVSKTTKIVVQNIVASANIGREINLNVVAFQLENSEYEPEQFPGLIYRMEEEKVVFLLFSTGRVICTGGKSKESIERALATLVNRLRQVKALKS